MRFKIVCFFFIVIFQISFYNVLLAQDFVHPGILHKEDDFARMRQKVAEKAEPWYGTWLTLNSSSEAQLGWNSRATATVNRGGTGDNVALLYRDVASAYQHALIYKINGDKNHGTKAVQIMNSWSSIHKTLGGNADRYLASGLFGYQFANAAEMMRGYPGFEFERFKNYMLNVYYYPLVERFLYGNQFGAEHNDACVTNYRANWDLANMASMLAIGILCDNRDIYNKGIKYFKTGAGNGCIMRSVNYLHTNLLGQWEESGRDQGHTLGGVALMGLFCEMAWNQGDDIFSYSDSRFRKGAEYVAIYNLMTKDSTGTLIGKYSLPYTSYSWKQGSNCSWKTESVLSSAGRGNGNPCWQQIFNHFARRAGMSEKIPAIREMLVQSPSNAVPSVSVHPGTYDNPNVGNLTFATDSGSCILPWLNIDLNFRSTAKLEHYGSVSSKDNRITILGSGSGFTGTADWGHFVYQKLIDDGSIITKITLIDKVDALSQSGLMIRENLEQGSVNALLSFSNEVGFVFSSRDSAGNATKFFLIENPIEKNPCWLMLSRSGDTITAFVSSDSVNWNHAGKSILKMHRLVYVGLAVSSFDKYSVCTSVFENTSVIKGKILAITPIHKVESLTFYPNPASNEINIQNAEGHELTLYNTLGNLVLQQNVSNSNQKVDISRITPGTYLLVTKDRVSANKQNVLIIR